MLCMSSSLSLAPHFSLYSSSPSSFLSPTPPFLPPPRFLQVLVQEVGVNIDLSFILAVTSLFAQLPSTATEVGPAWQSIDFASWSKLESTYSVLLFSNSRLIISHTLHFYTRVPIMHIAGMELWQDCHVTWDSFLECDVTFSIGWPFWHGCLAHRASADKIQSGTGKCSLIPRLLCAWEPGNEAKVNGNTKEIVVSETLVLMYFVA